MYKEIFIIVDDEEQELDTKKISLAKDFDAMLKRVGDNVDNIDTITAMNTSIYHGTIIPAKFIHQKINNLTEIYLIILNIFDTIDSLKNKNKSATLYGDFVKISPFLSLQDVTSFVTKAFNENHCDIEDLFLFAGYKMTTVDFTDLDEALDEAEVIPGISIAQQSKKILDLIEQAEVCIVQDIATGNGDVKDYVNILPLLSNTTLYGSTHAKN